jgi:hypothetical protein
MRPCLSTTSRRENARKGAACPSARVALMIIDHRSFLCDRQAQVQSVATGSEASERSLDPW